MVPSSSLTYDMSDTSLFLLSLLLASLYIIFAPSLVSSLVYNSSYVSSLAIATALLASLLASLYGQCCSSLLSFWYALNVSSLAVIARRVSSFHHRLSFSFPLVCPNFSLDVDIKISFILFLSRSSPISSSLVVTDALYSALAFYFFNSHHLICLFIFLVCFFIGVFNLYSMTRILCCIAMLSPGITLQSFAAFRSVLLTRI